MEGGERVVHTRPGCGCRRLRAGGAGQPTQAEQQHIDASPDLGHRSERQHPRAVPIHHDGDHLVGQDGVLDQDPIAELPPQVGRAQRPMRLAQISGAAPRAAADLLLDLALPSQLVPGVAVARSLRLDDLLLHDPEFGEFLVDAGLRLSARRRPGPRPGSVPARPGPGPDARAASGSPAQAGRVRRRDRTRGPAARARRTRPGAGPDHPGRPDSGAAGCGRTRRWPGNGPHEPSGGAGRAQNDQAPRRGGGSPGPVCADPTRGRSARRSDEHRSRRRATAAARGSRLRAGRLSMWPARRHRTGTGLPR